MRLDWCGTWRRKNDISEEKTATKRPRYVARSKRISTLGRIGILPYWFIAMTIQYMIPEKAMVPVSQPNKNARCGEVLRQDRSSGTRLIQARVPRLNCEKLRIRSMLDSTAAAKCNRAPSVFCRLASADCVSSLPLVFSVRDCSHVFSCML